MESLNATLQEVSRLINRADELELSRAAKQRLRWFEYALMHGRNVSLTCRYFGIARSTFLRWAERFDPKDPSSLEEHSRRPHRVRRPQTEKREVELIRAYRTNSPQMSKEQIQEALKEEHGIELSASTIGRVISRHGFFFAETPAHKRKRKQAVERLARSGFGASDLGEAPSEHGTPILLPSDLGFES